MALESAHTNPTTGARLTKAYLAVRKVELQYGDAGAAADGVVIHVGVWASQKARAQGLAPTAMHVFYTTLAALAPFMRASDGGDPRAPVYRWLKKRKPAAGDSHESQVDLRTATKV